MTAGAALTPLRLDSEPRAQASLDTQKTTPAPGCEGGRVAGRGVGHTGEHPAHSNGGGPESFAQQSAVHDRTESESSLLQQCQFARVKTLQTLLLLMII